MTDEIPEIPISPINQPSDAIREEFANWSDRELLLAIVVRINGMASVLVHIGQIMPATLGHPLVKNAMKFMMRGKDK